MNNLNVYAPASGAVFELADLSDQVFSTGMMGNGFVIENNDGQIVSPLEGKVSFIAETKHAIVVSNDNIDIMIHVGIDTCNLKGKPFEILVDDGEEVSKGKRLMNVDLPLIENKKLDSRVIVVFLERKDLGFVGEVPTQIEQEQKLDIA